MINVIAYIAVSFLTFVGIFQLGEAIEAGEEHMFGLFVMGFAIWCALIMITTFILNLLGRIPFIPCKIIDCYKPSPKNHTRHTCPKCKTKYMSSYGRKFGGLGMRWEIERDFIDC